MCADRWLIIGYLTCAWAFGGCRLPHNDGSVPAELVKSRDNSQKAAAAIDHSQWDQAETLLVQALKSCPRDTEARCYYAETLWHRGACERSPRQLEEARKQLEDGRAFPSMMPVSAPDCGNAIGRGQIDAARMRRSRPSISIEAGRGVGRPCAGDAGDATAATGLGRLPSRVGLRPEDRQTLLEVAELYREMGQPQRAIMTLQNLSDTYGPGEEPQRVLYLLGLAYEAAQRYDDAADSLATALQRGQPTPECSIVWPRSNWRWAGRRRRPMPRGRRSRWTHGTSPAASSWAASKWPNSRPARCIRGRIGKKPGRSLHRREAPARLSQERRSDLTTSMNFSKLTGFVI